MSETSGSGCASNAAWKSPSVGRRPIFAHSRYASPTQRAMIERSRSGRPSRPSAMSALESASTASVLYASLAASARSTTSAAPRGGVSTAEHPGASSTFAPPSAPPRLPYSPAGSKITTSSSGCASTVLVISRFTEKLLPDLGLPHTKPMGLARRWRSHSTRFPLSLDCP